MFSFALQRLMRDFKRLRQDPPQGVNGSPNPDNIMLWNAVIFGPEDTPWDGGKSTISSYHFLAFAAFLTVHLFQASATCMSFPTSTHLQLLASA